MMYKFLAKNFPSQPGVYIMKDRSGEVLYVGKAGDLKNRLRSYFLGSRLAGKRVSGSGNPKIQVLIERTGKVEWIETNNETEALLLENNLIKKHRPPFNIIMRDDKNYLYIKVPVMDEFPRIQLVRKVLNDRAKYFGPYVKSRAVHDTLKLINRIFPLCGETSTMTIKSIKAKKHRPCLNYHIGICPGVCVGEVSSEEYKKTISQVVDFLSGRYDEALKSMAQKMSRLSEMKKFEQAARLRDAIRAVKSIGEKQRVVTADLRVNQDVIGLARELNKAVVSLLQVRRGKLLHQQQYAMDSKYGADDAEIVASFLRDYYNRTQDFPKEVLLPVVVSEVEFFNKWLSSIAKYKVTVIKPIRGRKKQLVDLADRNAKVHFWELASKWRLENRGMAEGVEKLRKLLKLKKLNRIEAYDISNTGGINSVGSMVVFQQGVLDKKQYRRFKIKSVVGPNDFASLGEVLSRRFKHKTGDKSANNKVGLSGDRFAERPDLILIDGGKGQVNAVKKSLGNLKIKIIGMAKGDHSPSRAKDDLVIDNKVVILPNHSPIKYLLQNVRDEAHRFAYAYHVHIRRQRVQNSELEKISGIGPSTRKKLIKKFGSLAAVKEASLREIEKVVGKQKASMVKNQL